MVTLTGVGMDSTRLLLDRRNWSNFGYSFVVVPGRRGGRRDRPQPDGGRQPGGGGQRGGEHHPTANAGGGIKLGNSWTVTGCGCRTSTTSRAKDVTGGTISNCQFADLGAGVSGGNDNIGGGNAKSLSITGNTFTARSIGNSIDLLRSANLTISGNVITGTASNPHNMYLRASPTRSSRQHPDRLIDQRAVQRQLRLSHRSGQPPQRDRHRQHHHRPGGAGNLAALRRDPRHHHDRRRERHHQQHPSPARAPSEWWSWRRPTDW